MQTFLNVVISSSIGKHKDTTIFDNNLKLVMLVFIRVLSDEYPYARISVIFSFFVSSCIGKTSHQQHKGYTIVAFRAPPSTRHVHTVSQNVFFLPQVEICRFFVSDYLYYLQILDTVYHEREIFQVPLRFLV